MTLSPVNSPILHLREGAEGTSDSSTLVVLQLQPFHIK